MATLTFSILGYPFVFPDMIGGNAQKKTPSRDLYVRWTQLCVFLPGMQFSLPPWNYDDEVLSIIRNALNLRKEMSRYLINLALNVEKYGEPIIRPMWWYMLRMNKPC